LFGQRQPNEQASRAGGMQWREECGVSARWGAFEEAGIRPMGGKARRGGGGRRRATGWCAPFPRPPPLPPPPSGRAATGCRRSAARRSACAHLVRQVVDGQDAARVGEHAVRPVLGRQVDGQQRGVPVVGHEHDVLAVRAPVAELQNQAGLQRGQAEQREAELRRRRGAGAESALWPAEAPALLRWARQPGQAPPAWPACAAQRPTWLSP
jgi:hypothetical protein